MSGDRKVTGDYSRRYAVQVGQQAWSGMQPTRIEWRFERAFNDGFDAEACAERVSEDHEFVRVVDRNPSNG